MKVKINDAVYHSWSEICDHSSSQIHAVEQDN